VKIGNISDHYLANYSMKSLIYPNELEEEKKGVFDHLYNYAMMIIYPQVFPEIPNDTALKTLLQVQPKNLHTQLLNFCITR